MENITMFGIAGLPAILILCLLIGLAAKNAKFINDKWIPVICGVSGGILGIIGMNIIPGFPANDYISAAAVGAVSGLAATGAHQVFKQFTKTDNNELIDQYKRMAKDNEDCYLNVLSSYNEAQAELDLDDTFENFDLEEEK